MKSQVLLTAALAFPVYQTRSEYKKATGVEAPPYDENRKIKKWFDPNALVDGLPEVIYPNNIMLTKEKTWILRNGSPVIRPLVLPAEEAATVNLPPEDPTGATAIQAEWIEIPCPFRDLGPDEIIVVAGQEMGFLSGKVLVIRNTKLFAQEMAAQVEEGGKFTAADRALLQAIAKTLGV